MPSNFGRLFLENNLHVRKKVVLLPSQKRNKLFIKNDPVVQLVRMPPCHGGGRGFESRPDRNY